MNFDFGKSARLHPLALIGNPTVLFLCRAVLYPLYCILPHRTLLQYTLLHSLCPTPTVLYCVVLCCTVLYCTVLSPAACPRPYSARTTHSTAVPVYRTLSSNASLINYFHHYCCCCCHPTPPSLQHLQYNSPLPLILHHPTRRQPCHLLSHPSLPTFLTLLYFPFGTPKPHHLPEIPIPPTCFAVSQPRLLYSRTISSPMMPGTLQRTSVSIETTCSPPLQRPNHPPTSTTLTPSSPEMTFAQEIRDSVSHPRPLDFT